MRPATIQRVELWPLNPISLSSLTLTRKYTHYDFRMTTLKRSNAHPTPPWTLPSKPFDKTAVMHSFSPDSFDRPKNSVCRHPHDTPSFALYFDLKSCQFLYGKHCRANRVYGNDRQRVFRICSLAICGSRVTTTVKPPTCNAMR
jgi:hypothetical protein